MNDTTFDPKSILETYRNAFAPAVKAQQEGVKAVDRMSRYQYAVAGDYLEWSLAQAKLALAAQTPADFFSKQTELTTALSEKLRARTQELATIASETQASFTESMKNTTDGLAASASTAAAGAATKVSEATRKFEDTRKKAG